MVKQPAFLALLLVATLGGSASSSFAAGGSFTTPVAKRPIITNHRPQVSGSVTGLYFVGAHLLNVVQVVRGLGILEVPTRGTVYQTYGIQDGPDGCDPLGVKESRPRPPTPANTPVP